MLLSFEKYQAAGNDFIIIDIRIHPSFSLSKRKIQWLCDRHFGIGSDGLILIGPHAEHDFEMTFYNPDGSKSFCGNGSRCGVIFAYTHNYFQGKKCSFLSNSRLYKASLLSEKKVALRIGCISANEIKKWKQNEYFVHTGSPHYGVILPSHQALEKLPLTEEAHKIRYNKTFRKQGTNVNFIVIDKKNNNKIFIRTYERGVEQETLSCGSGVTASAIMAHHAYRKKTTGRFLYQIHTRGGNLQVSFSFYNNQYENITLTGPAIKVFSGQIDI